MHIYLFLYARVASRLPRPRKRDLDAWNLDNLVCHPEGSRWGDAGGREAPPFDPRGRAAPSMTERVLQRK